MLINVIDVGTPNTHATKNGRSYQSIEVTYKGENGQVSSKKLMSFANPDVFKQAQSWVKDTQVNINAQKDDNGYWQWVGILANGESAPVKHEANASVEMAKPKPATRVTGSNYETKEERADRQVMIVRQSSLSNAVATLALNKEGGGASADQVIALAKEYEAYVLGNTLDQLDDELPS